MSSIIPNQPGPRHRHTASRDQAVNPFADPSTVSTQHPFQNVPLQDRQQQGGTKQRELSYYGGDDRLGLDSAAVELSATTTSNHEPGDIIMAATAYPPPSAFGLDGDSVPQPRARPRPRFGDSTARPDRGSQAKSWYQSFVGSINPRQSMANRFSYFGNFGGGGGGRGSRSSMFFNSEGQRRDLWKNANERNRLQGLWTWKGTRIPDEDEQVGKVRSLWRSFKIWMINDGRRIIFYAVWCLVQILAFAFALLYYTFKDDLTGARNLFGVTYIMSRSAAQVLNIDLAFILLPICRNLMSFLRRTPLGDVIPFDKNLEFHQQIGWSIWFFSTWHTVSHQWNFWKLAKAQGTGVKGFFLANFWTGPGLTGWIMTIILWAMIWFAMEKRKRANFERFWYTHHLFVVFFLLWQVHGMFCMIKPDRAEYCRAAIYGVFWKYWLPGGAVFMAERILREVRASHKTTITKVIQHPSNVMEVQIKKEHTSARAGQYIFINCPEISYWQYHPFTLTSAPEEDYLSCHIRVEGDWTTAFAKALGCDFAKPERGVKQGKSGKSKKANKTIPDNLAVLAPKGTANPMALVGSHSNQSQDDRGQGTPLNRYLPRLMIDGPFGGASEDFHKYETVLLVGAGIGVTPFASILKSIWYRMNGIGHAGETHLSKVYFIWVIRDFGSAEFFHSLLEAIEAEDKDQRIEIHIYLTAKVTEDQMNNILLHDVGADKDTITNLRSPTHFGRPNWDRVFENLGGKHPDTDIGVFFCGPVPLSKQLHLMCNKHTTPEGCRFFFGKENF